MKDDEVIAHYVRAADGSPGVIRIGPLAEHVVVALPWLCILQTADGSPVRARSRRDLSRPWRGSAAARCRLARPLALPGGRYSGRCAARHDRAASQVTSESAESLVDRRPRVEYRCQLPGTPLSVCAPRSTNASPEPATRSRTVRKRVPRRAAAMAPTRAPTWTLNPVKSRPVRSSSPVWTPARTEMPSSSAALRIPSAHRTAWLGPSNRLNVPSPVTLMSRPPLCSTSSRTRRSSGSLAERAVFGVADPG